MTNETLAQYANLGLYSAMVVFTLAMIAFAVDLAGAAPKSLVAPSQNRQTPALVDALGSSQDDPPPLLSSARAQPCRGHARPRASR